MFSLLRSVRELTVNLNAINPMILVGLDKSSIRSGIELRIEYLAWFILIYVDNLLMIAFLAKAV